MYSFPAKSNSRASSDDDDFIVPDDSEEDASSRKTSSRRSSISSRRSTASENDDVFEEDALDLEEKPKKTKAKGKRKAVFKSTGGNPAGDASGTFGFLTAAEQRAQGKKEEKKAAEEPYSFLQDVRDVSSACRCTRHIRTITFFLEK